MFELLGLLGFIFTGALLLGVIFAWIVFFDHKKTKLRLFQLESELAQLKLKNISESNSESISESKVEEVEEVEEVEKVEQIQNLITNLSDTQTLIDETTKVDDEQLLPKPILNEKVKKNPSENSLQLSEVNTSQAYKSSQQSRLFSTTESKVHQPNAIEHFVAWVITNWMVSVGGLSVAIAGVFLVKYSMDQGYLSPALRISFSIMFGLILHAGAYYWMKKSKQVIASISALAGAGSITMYAAILAGLRMYDMFPSLIVFLLLAVISLLTMALALVYGPILAVMGIIGAMVVPLLVGSDSQGGINDILIYILVISASAQFLIKKVNRSWLHILVLVGALIWWALTFTHFLTPFSHLYLTGLLYLFVSIPYANYSLMQCFMPINIQPDQVSTNVFQKLTLGCQLYLLPIITIGGILIAQCISIIYEPNWTRSLLIWLPMFTILLFIYRANSVLRLLPWVMFLGYLISIFITSLFASNLHTDNIIVLYLSIALLMSLTLFTNRVNLINQVNRVICYEDAMQSALMVFAPLMSIALIYWSFESQLTLFNWAILSLLIGLSYLASSLNQLQKNNPSILVIWSMIASHFAFAMTFVMCFEQFYLTLALACQVLSLVWMFKRYQLNHVNFLVKALLAVIIIRLTFNPWLAQYDSTVHWTLFTYGGSVLLLFIASRICVETKLRQWLEAATLHVFVLFFNAEMRYWLYDGDIFSYAFSFTEVYLNMLMFGSVACVYHVRSKFAQSLKAIYQIASQILIALSVVSYFIILIPKNPLWNVDAISSFPIFNGLLLSFGLATVLWFAVSKVFEQKYQTGFKALAAFSGFVYISMNIHHLWQGQLNIEANISIAEQYTYSIVWLVIAVSVFVRSILKDQTALYKVAVSFLLFVIGKIFIMDMNALEGILRILSFLGLGLCLLALAALHNWLKNLNSSDEKALN
ncbi:DUF2339 domain-containing protein [Marinicellulosiphila megalodicopiae]|uniref:DUF2339 domain-containing protein n=1 Tax=Marinicellulosiphila megalodicopiae TaxID=2724896 RepID=UPI003BAFD469